MASLGLEQATTAPAAERSPSPQPPSLPGSPRSGSNVLAPSSSSPSLREMATRHRVSRFSPYSPALSFTKRRGSLSSVSSSSDFDSSPLSATFNIPARPTTSRPRRYRNNKLTVNTYESSSDLNADTPISTYVRRKTPGTSPTSPTFNPADSGYESSSPTPMPFSIPSLPVLLPHSASSDSFPNTPTSDEDMEIGPSSPTTAKPLTDITVVDSNYYRFIRRRTGTRLSTPNTNSRRKQIFHPAS
ncbi:hypothetical protein GALMADRAFT_235747 [Galerina marginata CBS 339.88]|uniref:Uncharacterized protein n=1 Tax=Galerina marginata (strain CBS 339.88) TaxID=685588 RepID=A0A067TUG0_GALM3|nr:hypothetical protein GALMADRAFT_235747 [Galerina marginata CBS 339.88]